MQPKDNDCYEAYPFYLYPWVFRNPSFRNWVTKSACQMLHYRSFEEQRVVEISLTVQEGIGPTRATKLGDVLYRALVQWFGQVGRTSTNIEVLGVRPKCGYTAFCLMAAAWPFL
jgi:hypothetical protein